MVVVVENFMIQVFVLPKLKRKKHLSVEMGVHGLCDLMMSEDSVPSPT